MMEKAKKQVVSACSWERWKIWISGKENLLEWKKKKKSGCESKSRDLECQLLSSHLINSGTM